MRETSGKCGGVGAEMENDRELLELAAKAAGYRANVRMQAERDAAGEGRLGLWIDGVSTCWNPRHNSAQAFDLGVKLRMSIEICEYENSSYAYAGDVPRFSAVELWRNDESDATRRAIVRAAAEIGRAME